MSIQFNPNLNPLELRKSESSISKVTQPNGSQEKESTGSFQNQIKDLLQEVDQIQKTSDNTVQGFADGRHNDIHGTMIGMQKADITFRLAANVRNKVIEAYREIMRMGA